jgi:hypothetical protein
MARRLGDPVEIGGRPAPRPIGTTPLSTLVLLVAGLLFGGLGGCGGGASPPIEGRYRLDLDATERLLREDLEGATDRQHRERIQKWLDPANRDRIAKWAIALEVDAVAVVTRPDGEFRGTWRRQGARIELTVGSDPPMLVELIDGGLLIDWPPASQPHRVRFNREN